MPFPYFFSISCLLGILCLVFPYKCSSFPQQHAFFSPLTRYSHSLPSPTPSSVTPHSHIPFLSLPSFFSNPFLSSRHSCSILYSAHALFSSERYLYIQPAKVQLFLQICKYPSYFVFYCFFGQTSVAQPSCPQNANKPYSLRAPPLFTPRLRAYATLRPFQQPNPTPHTYFPATT